VSIERAELDVRDRAAGDIAGFKERVLQAAIQRGLIGDRQLLAGFVDTAGVQRTIDSLVAAFPSHFHHMFAAKANSISHALQLVESTGLGCEAASVGELEQALRAGFSADRIVYDEPAKTVATLEFALHRGINFSIDNFQEYERVASLIGAGKPRGRVGFRINPQVGSGSIGAMSTATRTSKFGVALDDPGSREQIRECYRSHDWLDSIHTHIGSQGCPLDLMIRGIRKVMDLAIEINRSLGRQQIRVIDIGGGLPVNFDSDTVSPTFGDYAERLKETVPELFSGEFEVKTEFGRSIFAKNGFIATRVEYTKESGGQRIAITHAGAQTATRTAFVPELWAIRLSVFDASGVARGGTPLPQDVAGPCCFAGDMLARNRSLPCIEPGDHILLHDTGAYYFSNPFFYNSLPAIAVYGAQDDGSGRVSFDAWREQQSPGQLLEVVG